MAYLCTQQYPHHNSLSILWNKIKIRNKKYFYLLCEDYYQRHFIFKFTNWQEAIVLKYKKPMLRKKVQNQFQSTLSETYREAK